jgi:hypothetical protein
MKRGRKTGYEHSEETKEKISTSMTGKTKTEAHKYALSESRHNSDSRCLQRFLDMRKEYPGHSAFFDNNKVKLLRAMRNIKSEKELRDIRRYIETTHLEDVPQMCLAYQYDSSSIYAQEDAMIELIDTVRFLKKFNTEDFANLPLSN